MEKKLLIALCIGFVALIIMNRNLTTQLRFMEQNLQLNQSHQNMDILRINQDLRHEFHLLREEMAQANRLSFGEDVTITAFQPESQTATASVTFHLREFDPQATVTVLATSGDGQQVEAIATQGAPGQFFASLDIPLQASVELHFSAAGQQVIAGHLTAFHLPGMLADRFRLHTANSMWTLGRSGPGGRSIAPFFANNTGGNALFEVDRLYLVTLAQGQIVEEIPITALVQNRGANQVMEWDGNRPPLELDDSITAVKMVVYDRLGLRYEQMEWIPQPMPTHGGAMAPVPVGPAQQLFIGEHHDGRVISPGMDSFGRFYMVVE